MLINIYGAKCIGIEAVPVIVEVDINSGLGIHLVGLADIAVKESLLRTMTALQSSGFHIPGKKIVINLAPADMTKKGSGYDLPIAIGIIAASGQKDLPDKDRYIIMGELGLDASVREVAGALPMAELAARQDLKGIILPERSALEAADYDGTDVYGVRVLDDVLRILSGTEDVSGLLVKNLKVRDGRTGQQGAGRPDEYMDFSEIVGQEGAKRGLEIAAAGGHNVIMIGSPGSGKSSLAKALSGILPPMDKAEAILTSKIFSVAGKGGSRIGLSRSRPFRAPHHSASVAAIVGGGGGDNILPGEISLATGGILFLDEFGQMSKTVTEALRGPIEDRKVTISRLRCKVEYPASFMLVAASNPCPCGYYGEGDRCTCSVGQRQNYLGRLSGPIMDRLDLQLWMHPVEARALVGGPAAEPSAAVAARVLKAREIQKRRFSGEGILTNAEMNNRQTGRYCSLTRECKDLMERLISKMHLSARAYTRILKLARTIADLGAVADPLLWQEDGSLRPEAKLPPLGPAHLLEAAGYRFLDRLNPM